MTYLQNSLSIIWGWIKTHTKLVFAAALIAAADFFAYLMLGSGV